MANAAGDAHPYPVYGAHYLLQFPVFDADGDLVTAAAGLDSERSLDLGTYADCTNEAAEIATSSGMYSLYLTGAEMSAKIVGVITKTSTSGAKTAVNTLYPRRLPIMESGTAQAGAAGTITLAAGASAKDSFYNGLFVLITNDSPAGAQYQLRRVMSYVGSTRVATIDSNWGTNPSSASTYDILIPEGYDTKVWAGVKVGDPSTAGIPDTNAIRLGNTTQTGRDVGASVLLSSGTGAGQIDFTSGVVKANLAQILGTALTETAGLLAGGFKKFFNVASPTGTLNSIPDAVPDAVGGLPVTGNRLTAIPTVGSVTGAVGSVASGGIAAASFVAGAIDAAAIATDAIDADAVKADAVTEIQSGLATASALTTAQADLDDIQTRLPAALAADGSIKASVQSFLGTAFTEGAAGRIAAAFKQFFNIATPAATMDHGILVDTTTSLTTNNDKTGYSLTSAYDPAKTAAQAGDAMALTSGERTTLTASIWNALTSGLTTIGSIGKLLVDNINATISSRLASASYTAPPTAAENADAVWDETLADHLAAGSTGAGLNAAGSAGDPWGTALPGAYGAGTAGKIIGDNLDATVGSRSSHSAADVWAVATRLLTAGTNIVLAKGVGVTGLNDVSAADVNAQADQALLDVGLTSAVAARIDVAISTRLAASGYTAPNNAGITAIALDVAQLLLDVAQVPTADENRDAVFAQVIDGVRTFLQEQRLLLAEAGGKVDGSTTGVHTEHVRDVADSKDVVTAVVDGDGNRTSVTLDLS